MSVQFDLKTERFEDGVYSVVLINDVKVKNFVVVKAFVINLLGTGSTVVFPMGRYGWVF